MYEKSNGSLWSRAFRYKSVRRGFAITLVGLLVGNFFYQNHLEAVHHANEVARYMAAVSDYYKYGKKCTSVEQLPKIDYSSDPRSTKRIATATNYFYAIFNAECLILSDHKIYRNPYKNLTLNASDITSPGSIGYESWQGLLYEVDFGVPYLATGGTLCSDGWISGSFGRGTCSWHGGGCKKSRHKVHVRSCDSDSRS